MLRMTFCSAQASLMPLAALWADAVHVLQAGGLLLDDVENLLAELLHQLLRVNGADALDHAAAQILLDALPGGGRGAVEHVGAELEAKLPVLDPAALGGHPLPGADRSQGADHGDQVAVPFGLHLEHRPAVLLVEEGDALDQPGEAFRECRRGFLHWAFQRRRISSAVGLLPPQACSRRRRLGSRPQKCPTSVPLRSVR